MGGLLTWKGSLASPPGEHPLFLGVVAFPPRNSWLALAAYHWGGPEERAPFSPAPHWAGAGFASRVDWKAILPSSFSAVLGKAMPAGRGLRMPCFWTASLASPDTVRGEWLPHHRNLHAVGALSLPLWPLGP